MIAVALALPCLANAAENSQACPELANLFITSKSSSGIVFDWSDCTGGPNGAGCNQYLAKYYGQGDGYQSQVLAVTASEISFTGLPSGTYNFYFATDCGFGTGSWIVIEESIAN